MMRHMTTTKKIYLLAMMVTGLLLLGCDDSKPAPAPKKTNHYETGRFALQYMIPVARLWSPDAQPITLSSSPTTESPGQDGKSGSWRAVFGSRSRQKAEPFMWSGMADAPTKVDHGVEDSFNPNNRSTMPWDLAFLKVDTDKAFEVAQQHGGKQLTEKDPKLQVLYEIDWDAHSNQLRWHVIYGGSDSNSKLTVLVDASSGAFIRKE
jgi:hypothetical protein